MPYTSVDDLRLALSPGGVQDKATASDLSEDELADAIGEAQAEVDARLGARYTVPYADGQVPPLVAQLTRDVAAYGATLTHRRFQPLAQDHPVRLRYDKAQALLVQLARGTATIPDAEVVASTTDVAVANPYEGDLFVLQDFDLGPAPLYRDGPYG